LFAIVFAFGVWVILDKMIVGFEVKAVGSGANAAASGGINVNRIIWFVMIIGGGLAGMAGADLILGIYGQLIPVISGGLAWNGLAAAILAGYSPIWTIPSAFLFSGLIVGGEYMQRTAGVPPSVSFLIQGVLMITVVGSEIITRKMGLK
jgi:simple sugar transport system permease protein